jgi:hypothetical protein
MASMLGDVSFLDETLVYQNRESIKDRVFMAMGYPISKNKRGVDYTRREISATSWTYVANAVEIPELEREMGAKHGSHLFLSYGKHSTMERGARTSSVSQPGMSGGPIVCLGNFGKPGTLQRRGEVVLRVAGLTIERAKGHQALVAVKIQVLLDAIRQSPPEQGVRVL